MRLQPKWPGWRRSSWSDGRICPDRARANAWSKVYRSAGPVLEDGRPAVVFVFRTPEAWYDAYRRILALFEDTLGADSRGDCGSPLEARPWLADPCRPRAAGAALVPDPQRCGRVYSTTMPALSSKPVMVWRVLLSAS